ncbi:hypothetical protein R3I94_021670 [Phoxinus phoxinus]
MEGENHRQCYGKTCASQTMLMGTLVCPTYITCYITLNIAQVLHHMSKESPGSVMKLVFSRSIPSCILRRCWNELKPCWRD